MEWIYAGITSRFYESKPELRSCRTLVNNSRIRALTLYAVTRIWTRCVHLRTYIYNSHYIYLISHHRVSCNICIQERHMLHPPPISRSETGSHNSRRRWTRSLVPGLDSPHRWLIVHHDSCLATPTSTYFHHGVCRIHGTDQSTCANWTVVSYKGHVDTCWRTGTLSLYSYIRTINRWREYYVMTDQSFDMVDHFNEGAMLFGRWVDWRHVRDPNSKFHHPMSPLSALSTLLYILW